MNVNNGRKQCIACTCLRGLVYHFSLNPWNRLSDASILKFHMPSIFWKTVRDTEFLGYNIPENTNTICKHNTNKKPMGAAILKIILSHMTRTMWLSPPPPSRFWTCVHIFKFASGNISTFKHNNSYILSSYQVNNCIVFPQIYLKFFCCYD